MISTHKKGIRPMRRAPIHELPPGYHEIRYVRLTDDKLLLRLNLLAVIPLAGMLALMAVWWVVVSLGRAPEPQPQFPWWLALAAIILIVLPLHELVHGVVIRGLGHPVRYGAKLSKGVLYATAENALFRRDEYLMVALAPLVAITLAVMAGMAVAPQWMAYYLGIGAVLNAGGAIGDLYAVVVILRYPPGILVRDEADSFRLYAWGGTEGSSTQNTEPPAAG
jgi:hypothetical protein